MESEALLKRSFGLNTYEARVYLALAGERLKAKEVAERSGVPPSRTYDVLRTLGRMGLVAEASGTFEAVRPSVALRGRMVKLSSDFGREQASREEALRKIVSEVEPRFGRASGGNEPVMLKGMEGIASAFLEILKSSEEVFLLVRNGVEVGSAFLEFMAKEGRTPRVKVLVPRRLRLPRRELQAARRLGLQVRRGSGILLDMMVGSGSDVLVGVPARGSEESFGAVAIWIRNGSFASALRRSIAQEWASAEPA